MLSIDYKNDKPLHEQISSGIMEMIIAGTLKGGEKLPSVREMAIDLTVNPNTVQRAYKELEAEGVIYSVLGKGNFVSEGKNHNREKNLALSLELQNCVRKLAWLGEPQDKLEAMVKTIYTEGGIKDD